MKHVISDLIVITGMANADTQAEKIIIPQMTDCIAQAIVPAVTPTLLQAVVARDQIEFVVD